MPRKEEILKNPEAVASQRQRFKEKYPTYFTNITSSGGRNILQEPGAARKKYRDTNLDLVRHTIRLNKYRRKGAPGHHSKKQWEQLKAIYEWTCPMCWKTEPEIHLTEDHKIPIVLGGTNTIDNIQPLCGFDSYDKMGRVTQSRQITTAGTANSYTMMYQYDLAGNMTRETYPSNKVFITERDNAGRIAGVKKEGASYYAGASPTDAANRIQYTAQRAIGAMKLGNGKWERTLFNGRLQPTESDLGASNGASRVFSGNKKCRARCDVARQFLSERQIRPRKSNNPSTFRVQRPCSGNRSDRPINFLH